MGHFGKHASDEEAGDFVDLTSASHCHRKMSLRHTYFRLFYHDYVNLLLMDLSVRLDLKNQWPRLSGRK